MSRARKSISIEQACTILGIDRYSSKETGQAAFRALAKKFHPDTGGEEASVDKMQQVNAAWSLLKTQLKTQAQIDKEANKEQQEDEKEQRAEQARKAGAATMEFSDNGLTVELTGSFAAVDLIEALYAISGQYLTDLGDVVKNPSGMVDLFRAFATGRKHRVFSLALLDSKNRLIRTEELVSENPDIKAVATQALLHGAVKVYMVVNSIDGSVPKTLNTSQKLKHDSLCEGLALLGIEFIDYIIVGQAGYFSVSESRVIGKASANDAKAA